MEVDFRPQTEVCLAVAASVPFAVLACVAIAGPMAARVSCDHDGRLVVAADEAKVASRVPHGGVGLAGSCTGLGVVGVCRPRGVGGFAPVVVAHPAPIADEVVCAFETLGLEEEISRPLGSVTRGQVVRIILTMACVCVIVWVCI